jgi:hypothetical protein
MNLTAMAICLVNSCKWPTRRTNKEQNTKCLVYMHNAVSDLQCLLFWPFTFSFKCKLCLIVENTIFGSSNSLITNFCNHLQYRLLLSHSRTNNSCAVLKLYGRALKGSVVLWTEKFIPQIYKVFKFYFCSELKINFEVFASIFYVVLLHGTGNVGYVSQNFGDICFHDASGVNKHSLFKRKHISHAPSTYSI